MKNAAVHMHERLLRCAGPMAARVGVGRSGWFRPCCSGAGGYETRDCHVVFCHAFWFICLAFSTPPR